MAGSSDQLSADEFIWPRNVEDKLNKLSLDDKRSWAEIMEDEDRTRKLDPNVSPHAVSHNDYDSCSDGDSDDESDDDDDGSRTVIGSRRSSFETFTRTDFNPDLAERRKRKHATVHLVRARMTLTNTSRDLSHRLIRPHEVEDLCGPERWQPSLLEEPIYGSGLRKCSGPSKLRHELRADEIARDGGDSDFAIENDDDDEKDAFLTFCYQNERRRYPAV